MVYLRASVDEILRRTHKDRARPLLQTADRRGRITQLLAEREALYASIAHVTVHSSAGHPNRLVARLLQDEPVAAALGGG